MKRQLFVGLVSMYMAWAAQAAHWHTDFGEAQRKAYGENRIMLVYFTCSDNGGACERLRQEVFSKYEFQVFADRHLILVEVDFPRWKQLHPTQIKINRELADKYGGHGYPVVVLVNNRGQKIARISYTEGSGPEAYINAIERAANLADKGNASDSEPPQPLYNGAPIRPAPQYKDLTLKSISGAGAKRLALINNATLGVGESGKVRLGAGEVKIRCEEIRATSVIVTVEGKKGRQELKLLPAAPAKESAPQQATVKKK